MAMKTFYLKEHEGSVHNPNGQLSTVPWWTTFGSQAVNGESCGLLNALPIEQPAGGGENATKLARMATEKGLDKGNITRFTIFPGDCKPSGGGHKSVQGAISLQTALPEYYAHFDLGFGQPVICAKYPVVDQCYGLFSTFGPQISGRIMLPMSTTTDDVPIYVNAKQYHGIMRRRKSRAKAVLENKLPRNRKPYMHRSRHLHAMRRPRGCGGRFLNTKELNDEKGITEAKKAGDFQLSQPTGSQSSEVLESVGATLNSSMEANCGGSNLSGSEVTSLYNRGGFDRSLSIIMGQLSMVSQGWTEGMALACPVSGLQQLTTAATSNSKGADWVGACFMHKTKPELCWNMTTKSWLEVQYLVVRASRSWLQCINGTFAIPYSLAVMDWSEVLKT